MSVYCHKIATLVTSCSTNIMTVLLPILIKHIPSLLNVLHQNVGIYISKLMRWRFRVGLAGMLIGIIINCSYRFIPNDGGPATGAGNSYEPWHDMIKEKTWQDMVNKQWLGNPKSDTTLGSIARRGWSIAVLVLLTITRSVLLINLYKRSKMGYEMCVLLNMEALFAGMAMVGVWSFNIRWTTWAVLGYVIPASSVQLAQSKLDKFMLTRPVHAFKTVMWIVCIVSAVPVPIWTCSLYMGALWGDNNADEAGTDQSKHWAGMRLQFSWTNQGMLDADSAQPDDVVKYKKRWWKLKLGTGWVEHTWIWGTWDWTMMDVTAPGGSGLYVEGKFSQTVNAHFKTGQVYMDNNDTVSYKTSEWNTVKWDKNKRTFSNGETDVGEPSTGASFSGKLRRWEKTNGSTYDATTAQEGEVVWYQSTWWKFESGHGWVEQDWNQDRQIFEKKVGGVTAPGGSRLHVGGKFSKTVNAHFKTGQVYMDNNDTVSYKTSEWNKATWDGISENFVDGKTPANGERPNDVGMNGLRKWVDSCEYNASKPGNDDVVLYKSTWWKFENNNGWVEQQWHQDRQIFEKKADGSEPSEDVIIDGMFEGETPQISKTEANNAYMDGTGKVWWRKGVWNNVKWEGGTFVDGKIITVESTVRGKYRKWEKTNGSTYDATTAKEGEVVLFENTFWKRVKSTYWLEQDWNYSLQTFKDITDGVIAPLGNVLVNGYERSQNIVGFDINSLSGRPANNKLGAYKMGYGKVFYWLDSRGGGRWYDVKWDGSKGKFSNAGSGPTDFSLSLSQVRRWQYGMKLIDVEDNQELWYRGTIWKKISSELVQCTWTKDLKFENKSHGKSVPIGKSVKVQRFAPNLVETGNVTEGKAYMDVTTGKVWWRTVGWNNVKWDDGKFVDGKTPANGEEPSCAIDPRGDHLELVMSIMDPKKSGWKKVRWSNEGYSSGANAKERVTGTVIQIHKDETYDATTAQEGEVVWYQSTWWKFESGHGWVEQDWNQDRQIFEKKVGGVTAPVGNVAVNGFGKNNTTNTGNSNSGGVYKIDNRKVFLWDPNARAPLTAWDIFGFRWFIYGTWNKVKWDEMHGKFSKGAFAEATDGPPTNLWVRMRRWQHGMKLSDVEVGQELWYEGTLWKKETNKLVQCEWNEHKNKIGVMSVGSGGRKAPHGKKLTVGKVFANDQTVERGHNTWKEVEAGDALANNAYLVKNTGKVLWKGDGNTNSEQSGLANSNGNGKYRELKSEVSYNASKPDSDDLILYDKTWWRYVKGTGWVEQVWDEDMQRIMDKGVPVGPNGNDCVKSFGAAVEVEEMTVYDNWVHSRSYGPNDNQPGAYKIDSNGVVAYWDRGSKTWYNVEWSQSREEFTKGSMAIDEGGPTNLDDMIRKWNAAGTKMSDVEVGQEFYHENKWWVKQGGQLVEQEWNEANNRFEAKTRLLRGPSGKVMVGRFSDNEKTVDVLEGEHSPYFCNGELCYRPDKAYMHVQTEKVYYYAMKAVGGASWYYANWNQKTGKFYGSPWIRSRPSGNFREWIPIGGGPFDVDAAHDNVIVWENGRVWKKINSVWVEHTWDANNYKFVVKEETTVPPSGKGRVTVWMFKGAEVNLVEATKPNKAYMDYQGVVLYKYAREWTKATWDDKSQFNKGINPVEKPNGMVRKWEKVDTYNAEDGDVVWHNKSWWKYSSGTGWKQQVWDPREHKITDVGVIAPVGENTSVKGFGEITHTSDTGGYGPDSAEQGAYKMGYGKVFYWLDSRGGGRWYEVEWNAVRGTFNKGHQVAKDALRKGSQPIRRWQYGMKLIDVEDNQELWYRGTIWKKISSELVQCTWTKDLKFENKSHGKSVPIGKSVKVQRFAPNLVETGNVTEGKAYMDVTTGRVYWIAAKWNKATWDKMLEEFVNGGAATESRPSSSTMFREWEEVRAMYDTNDAKNGDIVRYGDTFWKYVTKEEWVAHEWDNDDQKIVEITGKGPPSGEVKVNGKFSETVNAPFMTDKAYMDNGGKVWWRKGVWNSVKWDETLQKFMDGGQPASGEPYYIVGKWQEVRDTYNANHAKYGDVVRYNNRFWKRVESGWEELDWERNEQKFKEKESDNKPSGDNISVARFEGNTVSVAQAKANNAYMDGTGKVWYKTSGWNKVKWTGGTFVDGKINTVESTVRGKYRKWEKTNDSTYDATTAQDEDVVFYNNVWWKFKSRNGWVQYTWDHSNQTIKRDNNSVTAPGGAGLYVDGKFSETEGNRLVTGYVYMDNSNKVWYKTSGWNKVEWTGGTFVDGGPANTKSPSCSTMVRKWEHSGDYNADRAQPGDVVWYNNTFWKRVDSGWEEHEWNQGRQKFEKKGVTAPGGRVRVEKWSASNMKEKLAYLGYASCFVMYPFMSYFRNMMYPGIIPYLLLSTEQCESVKQLQPWWLLLACTIMIVIDDDDMLNGFRKQLYAQWQYQALAWLCLTLLISVYVLAIRAIHGNGWASKHILGNQWLVHIMTGLFWFSCQIMEYISIVGVACMVSIGKAPREIRDLHRLMVQVCTFSCNRLVIG